MSGTRTLLRTRVEASRLKKAEKVFEKLGLKTSDAVNIFFAQVALRNDLPFTVATQPERLPEMKLRLNRGITR